MPRGWRLSFSEMEKPSAGFRTLLKSRAQHQAHEMAVTDIAICLAFAYWALSPTETGHRVVGIARVSIVFE